MAAESLGHAAASVGSETDIAAAVDYGIDGQPPMFAFSRRRTSSDCPFAWSTHTRPARPRQHRARARYSHHDRGLYAAAAVGGEERELSLCQSSPRHC